MIQQAIDPAASHLRAYMEFTVGDFAEAGRALAEAVTADPNNPALHFDSGIVHAVRHVWRDARDAFARTLTLREGFADAAFNLAVAESALGNRAAASRHLRTALGLEYTLIARIIRLWMRRAPATFSDLLVRTAWPVPTRDLPAVHDMIAFGFMKHGELAQAEAAERRAIALRPTGVRHAALGSILAEMGRLAEARVEIEQALRMEPGLEGADHHLGMLAYRMRDFSEARQRYDHIVARTPNDVFALSRLLLLDTIEGRFDAAEARFKNIARLAFRQGYASLSWEALSTIAYRSIMWPLPIPAQRALTAAIDTEIENLASLRGITFDHGPVGQGQRRRIGYLSANFRNHAIGHVTAQLFGAHDRDKFEIHVFAAGKLGARPYTKYTNIIEQGAEHFHHVPGKISEVADAIAKQKLDILVYVDGYMEHRLMQVIALRPAPIQVYWLGHAGGCELSCLQYMIADKTVVPEGEERNYRAKVIRLPDVYHCASAHEISATPSRQQAGLPEGGFVFAGFNNPEKIDRRIIDAWLRILNAVPESVMWLSRGPSEAFQTNLRAEAERVGIAGSRLIFAERLPDKADHLARQKHCGLLLDTITLNASTTALDALWSGVPVLTIYGDRFASRIASTMLLAVGLEEMICGSLEEYEQRAIHFARNPEALREVREKLDRNLKTHPLFDIARFCRNLEAGFEAIIADAKKTAGN